MKKWMNRSLLAGLAVTAVAGYAKADSFYRIAPGQADGDGDQNAVPTAISSTGVVVGNVSTSSPDDFTNAFYSPAPAVAGARTVTNLGGVGNSGDSRLAGVNSNGVAVGTYFGSGTSNPITYSPGTGYQTVTATSGGGQAASVLNAINNSGVFAGTGDLPNNGGQVPVYGTVGGTTLTTLPGIAGADNDQNTAEAINNNGLIVGAANPAGSAATVLFSYSSTGSATSLTNLGAPTNPNGKFSDVGTVEGVDGLGTNALGVNDAGLIAGTARFGSTNTANGFQHDQAFKYSNGAFTLLGGLTANVDASTKAYGVNNQGIIVGSSATAGGANDAVIWLPGSTTPTDLNTYFAAIDPADAARYTLSDATAINNSDVIVGTINADPDPGDDGLINNGAFILDLSRTLGAVPEPVSLGLSLPAAVMLGRRARRSS